MPPPRTDSELLIEIRRSRLGRGLYAARHFAEGDLVERAPIILGDTPIAEVHPWLQNYVYDWAAIGGRGASLAIALGHGSLFNSSTDANLSFRAGADNESIEYHAVREIEPGEQLTINYSSDHGGPRSSDNSWFTDRGIEFHEG